MSELKPCPFCGGEAFTETWSAGSNDGLWFGIVECVNEDCPARPQVWSGNHATEGAALAAAAARWDTRAPERFNAPPATSRNDG